MKLKAIRAKRAAEQMAEDAAARINELNTMNVNLTSIRVKLEQELAAYAADFEEASKELKVRIPFFSSIFIVRVILNHHFVY